MFDTKQKQVFRKAALERLSSPEELDQLMQVITPKGWMALIGLAALLVAALIWGIFGGVPTKVQGQGVLLRTEGIYHVAALSPGQVSDLYVTAGDMVAQGQTVARILQTGTGLTSGARVISPQAGRVLEMRTTVGSVVNVGSPILSLEAPDQADKNVEAIIYVSAADGKKVRSDMTVEVTPATVKREEFGFIPGRVMSVTSWPVSKQGMLRTLGSEELTELFSSSGAVIEIRADLAKDPNSPSGYKWSSKGPDVTIDNGTLCTVQIVTEQRRPISLVIPMLKKMLAGPLFKK